MKKPLTKKKLKNKGITASEALFGFMGWLTSRKDAVTFGSTNDAAPAVQLVGEWLDLNHLPRPRRGVYPDNIRQPPNGYTTVRAEDFKVLKTLTGTVPEEKP